MKVEAHEGFSGVDIQLTRHELQFAITEYVQRRGLNIHGGMKIWIDGASLEAAATIQLYPERGGMLIADEEKIKANGPIEFC